MRDICFALQAAALMNRQSTLTQRIILMALKPLLDATGGTPVKERSHVEHLKRIFSLRCARLEADIDTPGEQARSLKSDLLHESRWFLNYVSEYAKELERLAERGKDHEQPLRAYSTRTTFVLGGDKHNMPIKRRITVASYYLGQPSDPPVRHCTILRLDPSGTICGP